MLLNICSLFLKRSRSTLVSAPGKVLVSGGYAILHPEYSGFVMTTSSRISCEVKLPELSSELAYDNAIKVVSDRFGMEETVALDENNELRPEDSSFEGRLLFNCLRYAVGMIGEEIELPLELKIDTHPDFYDGSRKTGLGSSAACTVSTISSLLYHHDYFSRFDVSNEDEELDLLYRICYLVHNICQGKVGSGFDVSSAIFGTQIYSAPSIIHMDSELLDIEPKDIESYIFETELWDHRKEKVQLSPNIHLLMAQTSSGSKTPSLIGKVKAWASQYNLEYRCVMEDLHEKNSLFIDLLNDVSKNMNGGESVGGFSSSQDHVNNFYELTDIYLQILNSMKSLGEVSGASIVPEKQERIIMDTLDLIEKNRDGHDLDGSSLCPPVIGLPGAGGEDAIFGLFAGTEAKEFVKERWMESEDIVRVLALHEDHNGLIVEKMY